jgi:hypothetical protein
MHTYVKLVICLIFRPLDVEFDLHYLAFDPYLN